MVLSLRCRQNLKKRQKKKEPGFNADLDFPKPQVLVFHKIEDVIGKLEEFNDTDYSKGNPYIDHALQHHSRHHIVGG